jgi:hypothetical protein
MGKSGNLVGYGIVCVGVPIGDARFIHRYLELKEGGVFEKFDRSGQVRSGILLGRSLRP